MKPSGAPAGLHTFLVTVAGLLRQWRLVATIPLLCVVLAVVWVLVVHPIYRAGTTFIVDSEMSKLRGVGGLASLAGQFGLPLNSGSQSPAFFADLVTSREVLLA